MVKQEALLHFVETLVFRKRLDKSGDLSTLFAIQAELLENPGRGDIIKGCGGARKARIGSPLSGRGKRGSLRYIYLYLEQAETVFLLMLYAKDEQKDLSVDEKKLVRDLISRYKNI